MKTFAVFPTICVFSLTLTLLTVGGQLRAQTALLWSIMMTVIFGELMTWFSEDVFFFLYYANFLGVIILIPCFTYLANKLFKDTPNKIKWFRILGLGLASTILTIAIFVTSMFFSFTSNPMNPAPRQGQNKSKGE
jgi:hypothetical protein